MRRPSQNLTKDRVEAITSYPHQYLEHAYSNRRLLSNSGCVRSPDRYYLVPERLVCASHLTVRMQPEGLTRTTEFFEHVGQQMFCAPRLQVRDTTTPTRLQDCQQPYSCDVRSKTLLRVFRTRGVAIVRCVIKRTFAP